MGRRFWPVTSLRQTKQDAAREEEGSRQEEVAREEGDRQEAEEVAREEGSGEEGAGEEGAGEEEVARQEEGVGQEVGVSALQRGRAGRVSEDSNCNMSVRTAVRRDGGV